MGDVHKHESNGKYIKRAEVYVRGVLGWEAAIMNLVQPLSAAFRKVLVRKTLQMFISRRMGQVGNGRHFLSLMWEVNIYLPPQRSWAHPFSVWKPQVETI